MKTSAIKGLFAAAAAVILAATPLIGRGVTVDVTKFQQRYPWNGLVDIDYTITRAENDATLDPAKHSVRISVVNCDVKPATTNVAHIFLQLTPIPVSDGAHRVTWDANAENITFKSQNVKIFAEIVHYAEKYMVIDVSGGPSATVYPVTYLNGAPAGGFNKDEYKGSNIVLRLIRPGTFVMGSPTTEPGRTAAREVQHVVTITKPFYIGVFEITQKQYQNVMNENPSGNKPAGSDYRPVENVSFETIRGATPAGTRQYDWPHSQDVDMEKSFMGKLRAKCKEWDLDKHDYAKDVDGLFDLPTEAQWEYACRAGTTSAYNNGAGVDLNLLGRYASNGGLQSQHVVVGTAGASNAWGLYDMHGNVWELCLDWYQENVQDLENSSVDPVGAASGTSRVRRGGSWAHEAQDCRSATRNFIDPATVQSFIGFRLSMTLP